MQMETQLNKTTRIIYHSFNAFFFITGVVSLYFSSEVWLGTEEDRRAQIINHTVEYFFSRLAFDLIVIAALLMAITIFNILYLRLTRGIATKNIYRMALSHLVGFFITSIILIALSMR